MTRPKCKGCNRQLKHNATQGKLCPDCLKKRTQRVEEILDGLDHPDKRDTSGKRN